MSCSETSRFRQRPALYNIGGTWTHGDRTYQGYRIRGTNGLIRVGNILPVREGGTDVVRKDWVINFPENDWEILEMSHHCSKDKVCSWFIDRHRDGRHGIKFFYQCTWCLKRVPADIKDYFNKAYELYYGLT